MYDFNSDWPNSISTNNFNIQYEWCCWLNHIFNLISLCQGVGSPKCQTIQNLTTIVSQKDQLFYTNEVQSDPFLLVIMCNLKQQCPALLVLIQLLSQTKWKSTRPRPNALFPFRSPTRVCTETCKYSQNNVVSIIKGITLKVIWCRRKSVDPLTRSHLMSRPFLKRRMQSREQRAKLGWLMA